MMWNNLQTPLNMIQGSHQSTLTKSEALVQTIWQTPLHSCVTSRIGNISDWQVNSVWQLEDVCMNTECWNKIEKDMDRVRKTVGLAWSSVAWYLQCVNSLSSRIRLKILEILNVNNIFCQYILHISCEIALGWKASKPQSTLVQHWSSTQHN